MIVIVSSRSHPPASLYDAARELPACPGCVGSIELYRMSDGWRADVMHEPTCSWIPAEERGTETETAVILHFPARRGAGPVGGICPAS